MENFVSKKLCWFMIFILIFMWSGIIEHKAFAKQIKDLSSKELEQRANNLESLFDALEESMQELPRDTFDPDAIIEKVGKDPIKLFEWVRDNTCLVPYNGSLRGPKGVLLDRLGNSLDRALLLYKLLRITGHKTRLVKGVLTSTQAKELLTKAYKSLKISRQKFDKSSEFNFKEQIEKLIKEYQINPNIIDNLQSEPLSAKKNRAIEISKRVKDQTAKIAAAVEMLRTDNATEKYNLDLKALQNHWWVQFEKEGSWINLDPVPNAIFKNAITEPIEFLRPEDILQDLLHLVKIRVIVERYEEESLKEDVALEYTLRPTEVIGERIIVQHSPMNWPEVTKFFQSENPIQFLITTILDQTEWLPTLVVGSKQIAASSFFDTGKINESPGKKSKTTGAGRISGGILGGLAGKEGEKDSQLTAEWIEYEIIVPERTNQKIRRQIFDSLGPAARASQEIPKPKISDSEKLDQGLALIGETEILLQNCQPSPEFLVYLSANNLLANKKILLEIFRQQDSLKQKDLNDKLNEIKPLPGPTNILAIVRNQWNSSPEPVYLNYPNILSFHSFFKKDNSNLLLCEAFDIVYNGVTVNPNSDSDPFLICLEHGILDTNAEAFLLAPCMDTKNAGEIFSHSFKQGIEWTTIRDHDDLDLKGSWLPLDTKTRISQNLLEGYVILIPKTAVPVDGRTAVAWWIINPKSGNILGIGEEGWGQEMTDYALLQTLVSLGAFGNCIAGSIISNSGKDDPRPKKDREKAMLGSMIACVMVFTAALIGIRYIDIAPAGSGKVGVYIFVIAALLGSSSSY